jgi:GNAT superfamily N-acetyltransferase
VILATRPDGYEIDTDPARVDLDRLHTWLSTDAYWALGRPRETVERAVAHSNSYGLYHPSAGMVGYGRAITDRATFAYLCDVYLDRAVRGRGLGTWLVATACEHLKQLGCRRLMLATDDAHGVYARLGFGSLKDPTKWMEFLAGRS